MSGPKSKTTDPTGSGPASAIMFCRRLEARVRESGHDGHDLSSLLERLHAIRDAFEELGLADDLEARAQLWSRLRSLGHEVDELATGSDR